MLLKYAHMFMHVQVVVSIICLPPTWARLQSSAFFAPSELKPSTSRSPFVMGYDGAFVLGICLGSKSQYMDCFRK